MIVITIEALVSQAAWVNYLLHYYKKDLGDFLESKNLIGFNQGGFRGGYRTTDHIYILKTLINKYLMKHKNKLYVYFAVFKKTFDSVVRKALLHKLLKKGIGGKFFDLVTNMYSSNYVFL